MNLAIMWTPEAEQTFEATFNQIEAKWGSASAKKFVQTANRIVATISTQPYMFIASYTTNVRRATVTKQTSMFYEVHTAHITILFFWDNRQEPLL
jgi:plasmid stabilization system protein ParE